MPDVWEILRPFALALALAGVPAVLGFWVASSLRVLSFGGRALRAGAALAGLALVGGALAAAPLWPWLGSWDLVACAALLGAGLVVGVRGARGRAAVFAAGALAVLEIAARLVPAPAFPPAREARLTFDPEEREGVRRALPRRLPGRLRLVHAPRGRGDSARPPPRGFDGVRQWRCLRRRRSPRCWSRSSLGWRTSTPGSPARAPTRTGSSPAPGWRSCR